MHAFQLEPRLCPALASRANWPHLVNCRKGASAGTSLPRRYQAHKVGPRENLSHWNYGATSCQASLLHHLTARVCHGKVRVTVPLTKAPVCGDFRCQQGLSILGSDAWLEPEVFNGYLRRVVVNPASPGSRDEGERLGLSWYLEMWGGGGDGSGGGGCKCQYSGLAENKAHRTQPPSVLSVCNPRDPTLGPGACDLHGRLFSSI